MVLVWPRCGGGICADAGIRKQDSTEGQDIFQEYEFNTDKFCVFSEVARSDPNGRHNSGVARHSWHQSAEKRRSGHAYPTTPKILRKDLIRPFG
jgi:hypothetical protein